MKKYSFLSIIILLSFKLSAQQTAMYTQYMFNGLIINPAYAGSREVINLTALHRNQWYNVNGAPQTYTFSADAPIINDKVGIGLSIVHDRIGVTQNTDIAGYYSYRIKFSDDQVLSLGLSAIFTQYVADLNTLNLSPDGAKGNDDAFNSRVNMQLPNFGAGAYYYTKKFYIGVSVPTFLSNRLNNKILGPSNIFARQFQHIFFTAGYVFDLSSDVKLKPSVLYKAVSGAPMGLDINASIWFYDVVCFGVSYRSFDSVDFLFELQLTPQFRLGYAYDRSLNYRFNQTGSHEFMLNYAFGYGKGKIVSPRYF